MKDDAPRVIKIPAKPEATRQAEARRQLRVAAYCRVSTKEEDQANSYEVQKEYYTDKIMSQHRLDDGRHLCGQGHHRNLGQEA